MTGDPWLRAHAWLEPIGRLCARVDEAATAVRASVPTSPRWDDYADDFEAGVPLLLSAAAAVDLDRAGTWVGSLFGVLARDGATSKLDEDIGALHAELRRAEGSGRRLVDWLLGEEGFVVGSPGLLRFLGWSAMAHCLRPLVDAFAAWRVEERWHRSYCPTCGSPPAMAQLTGADPARKRFLSCGRCRTRWQYNRTRCPFCEHDSQRLAIVAIEGEGGLRIDWCESCRGYLKTYVGEGDEALLLADWSSLHLDLVARDRGLKRLGVSLFELEASAT